MPIIDGNMDWAHLVLLELLAFCTPSAAQTDGYLHDLHVLRVRRMQLRPTRDVQTLTPASHAGELGGDLKIQIQGKWSRTLHTTPDGQETEKRAMIWRGQRRPDLTKISDRSRERRTEAGK